MPDKDPFTPLTIVQLSPEADQRIGDYRYRIAQPGEAMGMIPGVSLVHVTNTCPHVYEFCLAADVLVLHLISEHNLLPVVEERRRRALPTVFEISDNFLAFPPWVPFRQWFQDPEYLSTTFQLIQKANAVQGVSELLLQQFAFLNGRQRVFENHLEKAPPLRPRTGDPILIGWGGSLGHKEDIAWIAPTIREICRRHSHVRFAFMGNKRAYDEVFGPDPGPRFQYREPGSLEDYYTFLESLDIGLAPMVDTPYNRCRSDVKFIEYASRGAVPVLTGLGPYTLHTRHGENCLLFQCLDELLDLLHGLVNDPGRLNRIRETAYHDVKTERIERPRAEDRVLFYRSLTRKGNSLPFPWHLVQRVSDRSRLHIPIPNPAERDLLQGTLAAGQGRTGTALKLWRRAAQENAGYELPHLCIGRNLAESDLQGAVSAFQEALHANPASIHALWLMGKTFRRDALEQALTAFEKALDVYAEFAPVWYELGVIEQGRENLDRALAFFNRALESNPFYAPAAFAMGKVLQAQCREENAVQAMHVAMDLLPEREEYQLGLMEALWKAGDRQGAMDLGLEFLRKFPRHGHARRFFTSMVGMAPDGGLPAKTFFPNA